MTTKREKELLEEIESMREKLEHAEKWMTRQIAETAPLGAGFFSHVKPKLSIYDRIVDFAEKVRHIRLLRHRYTRTELWMKRIEAFLIGAAIILFWRGIWNLADHYLFPDHSNISAFASLFIGLGILMLSKNFVNQFIDDAVEEADEYE